MSTTRDVCAWTAKQTKSRTAARTIRERMVSPLDDFFLAQGLDGRRVVTQVLENLLGVLADLGRGGGHASRRARQPHRLVDDADVTELRALQARRRADVLHLRVVEHLVDAVDRPAGHLR